MKFLRIDKQILETDLVDSTNPTNCSGYRISLIESPPGIPGYEGLKFTCVDQNGATTSSYKDYTIGGSDMELVDSSLNSLTNPFFTLSDLFPFVINWVPSGDSFFFIGYGSLAYALTTGNFVNTALISLSTFTPGMSGIGFNYEFNYYTIKIEFCQVTGIGGGYTISLGSYDIAPAILIAVPCPPVWRPGYSGGPHARYAAVPRKKIDKLHEQVEKTIEKSKAKFEDKSNS